MVPELPSEAAWPATANITEPPWDSCTLKLLVLPDAVKVYVIVIPPLVQLQVPVPVEAAPLGGAIIAAKLFKQVFA